MVYRPPACSMSEALSHDRTECWLVVFGPKLHGQTLASLDDVRKIVREARKAIESEARDLSALSASLDPSSTGLEGGDAELGGQVQPACESFVEGVLGLDVNALCHYGCSLWRDKKQPEEARRILQRVLEVDPALPVSNVSLALPGPSECLCLDLCACVGVCAV